MKSLSVLLFCVFVSYTFSDKENVTHTGTVVSFTIVTKSNTVKGIFNQCTKEYCYLHELIPRRSCCLGLRCVCKKIRHNCWCSSQNVIHVMNNGMIQTVASILSSLAILY
ncbi:uncharacterized protein LOC128250516 isoform X2 [Octopus bimaculoides]|uniref:uncharacterized protein LOC128250516 isoform X2 n=1 Tax=Octopus bimaculoides TaxID=37653 RepID=UPI0022E66D3A|nr:uncharacterized protein LOC128250516 isoform X2 [Octopus bimaculoides]